MKVFKRFLIADREILNDSYVAAATDGKVLGLSIHDGTSTVSFNFDASEEGRKSATQTLHGLETAVAFLRKEGSVVGGLHAQWIPRFLASLAKVTSRPSP